MAAFTQNVVLRSPVTGDPVGFLKGDDAPEWAAEQTDHLDDAQAPETDTQSEPETEAKTEAAKPAQRRTTKK